MYQDLIYNIALFLPYHDLKNFFLINKFAFSLFKNDFFWKSKYKREYLPTLKKLSCVRISFAYKEI